MESLKIPEKFYQYLVYLFDTPANHDIHEFLLHSDIYISETSHISYRDAYKLSIIVNPEIYKKHQGLLRQFKESVTSKFKEIKNIIIVSTEILPDLNKFQIIKNSFTIVITPWEIINNEQIHLLTLLRTAKETIDFQNIGNTSRTLLQKLSNLIFDPNKHIAENPSIDLSEGKFKNRLHTYIKIELEGKENKELRDFATSVITTAEKSVDLANKLTHDLNAISLMAEACVISTITAISIIKLIAK